MNYNMVIDFQVGLRDGESGREGRKWDGEEKMGRGRVWRRQEEWQTPPAVIRFHD